MIKNFGIESVAQASEPNIVITSLTYPSSVSSDAPSTASTSLKQCLPVKSSDACADGGGSIKKIRENLFYKHTTIPEVAVDLTIAEI